MKSVFVLLSPLQYAGKWACSQERRDERGTRFTAGSEKQVTKSGINVIMLFVRMIIALRCRYGRLPQIGPFGGDGSQQILLEIKHLAASL